MRTLTHTQQTHYVWTDCIGICIQVGEGGGRLDGYLFCKTACNATTSLQILYRAFQATTEKLFTVVVGTCIGQNTLGLGKKHIEILQPV